MSRLWGWACAVMVATIGCNALEESVAKDSVDQYEIAKRSGKAIDICVHAGLVSAAYLQAKNEPEYKKWKAIETADCERAGMPQ